MIPFEVKLERNEDLYSVVYVEPDKPKLYKADGIDLSSITEPLQIPKISKQIKDFKVKHELSSEALSNFMKQLMNFIKRLKKDFNIEVENLRKIFRITIITIEKNVTFYPYQTLRLACVMVNLP